MSVISRVALRNFASVEVVIHLSSKQEHLLPRNIQMVPVVDTEKCVENLGVQGFVSLRNLTPSLVIAGLALVRLVYETDARRGKLLGHKVILTYVHCGEPIWVGSDTALDMAELLQSTWDSLKLYRVKVGSSVSLRADVSGSRSDDPGLGELRCDDGLMYLRWRSRQLFEGYGPLPKRSSLARAAV